MPIDSNTLNNNYKELGYIMYKYLKHKLLQQSNIDKQKTNNTCQNDVIIHKIFSLLQTSLMNYEFNNVESKVISLSTFPLYSNQMLKVQ